MTLLQSFRGIIPPFLTPLTGSMTLDHRGLETLTLRLLAGGVHGLFLLGTCGEGVSLSQSVQRDVVRRVMGVVAGRVPILVAISHTSLDESIALAHDVAAMGVSGLVATTPYYYQISQEDLVRYMLRLADRLPLPLLLYNIPVLTKVAFEIATLCELFQHANICGLKDSSGDMEYFASVARLLANDTRRTLLIGPEHLLLESLRLGGDGGVCGGANLLPQLFTKLYDASCQNDAELLETLHRRLVELQQLYTGFPGASFLQNVKCALSLLGICQGGMAEPLSPLSPESASSVKVQLERLSITAESLE